MIRVVFGGRFVHRFLGFAHHFSTKILHVEGLRTEKPGFVKEVLIPRAC